MSGLSVCPPYSGQEDAPSIRGQVYGIIFEVQSLEEEFTLDMSFQFLFNVNVMLCLVHVDAKYMATVEQCFEGSLSSYVNGYLVLVVQSMDESLALVLPTLELSSRKLDCLPRVLE